LLRRLTGLPGVVLHLAYAPDGRYMAATLFREGSRVYRTSDYQEIARDTDYGAESYWGEFDRSGRLVTTSLDGYVRLYNSEFGLISKRAARGGKFPYCARFSPDGASIAVQFADSTVINALSAENLDFLHASDTSQTMLSSVNQVAWTTDGRALYVGGKIRDLEIWQIVSRPYGGSWAYGGFSARETGLPMVANDMIGGLVSLSGGRLAYGAGTPMVGVLETEGHARTLWERLPEIPDYRPILTKQLLYLSRDGAVVEFDFAAWTRKESKRQVRFSVAGRQLTLEPEPSSELLAPRASGLNVEGWSGTTQPTFEGRRLPLNERERSLSLAISAKADSFLLGTNWYLRCFDQQGRRRWDVPVQSAFKVNLTADSRYAVAALGDGTVRWYATENGREVLALFVHADGQRWVAWTPEGFFDASPGGDGLIGYHLNQDWEREGEFVSADRLRDVFYRPDLVAQRLMPSGGGAIAAAETRVGDINKVLAGGLPPELELLSPAEAESDGQYELRLRVNRRGGGVGRVVYRIDGVEIEGRPVDIPAPGGDTISRRFDLAPGRHEVTATAHNRRNQLESRSVSAVVNVKGADAGPALYVVAAGVTNYRDHALAQGVKFAGRDAEAVAARLKEQGANLFRQVSTWPLVDDKATRENIRKAVAEVAGSIRSSDVFVLYLAGHGSAEEGEYYFLPWEVQYKNREELLKQSLGQEELRQLLAMIPVRKTLVLLDTCGSGAFVGRGLEEKAAIDRLARITGRAVLAASSSAQMALEGYEGHGVFTYAVLEGLRKADSGNNGLVEVSELADFVEALVPRITIERWKYEQFPMRDLKGQSFPISRRQ
jgi:hypothetical protein